MVDIIDEAGVRIVAVIDPAFNAKVKKAVAKSLRGVDKQIRQSLRPVSRAVEDSIVQPFERAGARLSVIAQTSGEGIARGIESGTDEASREIDRLVTRANAELGRITADIDLDTSAAQSQIESFLAVNIGRTVEVDLDVVTAMAQTQVESFLAANLEPLEVNLDLTTTKAQVEIDRFLANSLDSLNVDLDLDTSAAEAQIDAFMANALGDLNIDLDVDTAFAQAEVDAFLAANDGRSIDIDVDVDRDRLGGIAGLLDGIGSSAGRSTRLVRPLYAALGAVAVAAVPLAGAVAVASGALLSAGAAASSLALGFTAVRVGSEGVGDALKAQSKAQEELSRTGEVSAATQEALADAMENLAPAARDLVRTIARIGPAWTKVRKATQQALFEDTAPLLQRLSDAYLPAVSAALEGVASDFNKMARSAVDALTSASAVDGVTRALESMREQLQNIVPALGNIATGLGILFLGATGEAEDLSRAFLRVSETFEEFTRRVTSDGSFQKFLNDATKAADSLFEAIGAVGGVIGTILGASAGQGVSALDSITRAFRALDEQLESVAGQRAIQGFFEGLYTVVGIVTDTIGNLGPVFAGLGDIFEATEKPLKRLREALEPFTEDLFQSIGDTLSDLAGPISRIVDAFADLVRYIQPIAKYLGPVVVAIGAIAAFASPVGALAGAFSAVASALAAASAPVLITAAAIAAIVAALVIAYNESESFRESVQKSFEAIKEAIIDAWDKIRPALEDLWETIQDDLIPAFEDLWEALQPVADFIGQTLIPLLIDLESGKLRNVINTLVFLARVWAAQIRIVTDVINVIREFGGWVGRTFSRVREAVGTAFDFVKEKLGEFGETLSEAVGSVRRFASRVGQFFQNLRDRVGEIVGRISDRVTEIFQNLPGRVGRVLGPLPGIVLRILQNVLASARQKASEIVSTVRAKLAELPGKIRELGGRLFSAGKAIMDRLVDGLSAVGGVAGDIASAVGEALKGVVNGIIGQINSGIRGAVSGINKIPGVSVDAPQIPELANGAIVRRPTTALIGEAGPEVVLPLVSARINRALALLRQSGLLDSPQVQRAVLARTPLATPQSITTLSNRSSTRITGAPTRVTNNAITQNFNLAPVADAETLFAQIANRTAAYIER